MTAYYQYLNTHIWIICSETSRVQVLLSRYFTYSSVFEIVFKYDACLLPELLRNFYDNADDDDVTAADGDGDSDDDNWWLFFNQFFFAQTFTNSWLVSSLVESFDANNSVYLDCYTKIELELGGSCYLKHRYWHFVFKGNRLSWGTAHFYWP